jgi:hypothetical protein
MRARFRRWPSVMQSSAAVNGLGIALESTRLESTRLAERELASGQLVQILAR